MANPFSAILSSRKDSFLSFISLSRPSIMADLNSLTSLLIKKGEDGEISITQACAVAGLGGNPYRDGSYSYYVNERKKDNDPKATGSFILAALELDK